MQDTTLGESHDTPFGLGQQLCKVSHKRRKKLKVDMTWTDWQRDRLISINPKLCLRSGQKGIMFTIVFSLCLITIMKHSIIQYCYFLKIQNLLFVVEMHLIHKSQLLGICSVFLFIISSYIFIVVMTVNITKCVNKLAKLMTHYCQFKPK